MLVTILIFILILGALIFVHELGHFIAARRAGMKVEEFGFGFLPRMFGIKKGGTIYSLNWIPVGGFVRILGENGETDEAGAFSGKSAGKRFIVLIAGVAMNALFAWFLLTVGLMLGTPTLIDEGSNIPTNARIGEQQVTVLFVEPESPAQTAGLKMGDVILSVSGTEAERSPRSRMSPACARERRSVMKYHGVQM